MSNDLSWILAGLDRVEGHVLDSSGNIGGTTGTVTAGAAGSPGFRILGAKEAQNIGAPAPDIVPVTGDDAYLGGFIFPSAQARQFALICAVMDLDVNGYLGGAPGYNIGNSSVGFIDSTPFNPVNVALITVSQAKSQQSGNLGQGIWSGVIISKAQGVALGRESAAERAAGAHRYAFVLSLADRFPWGETFQYSVHRVNQAVQMPWSANNRKSMHVFKGDGSTLAFGPLRYTPASTSLLDVVPYKNGYRQTSGITVSTSTKFLTFVTPPANGDLVPVYYDHVGS